MVDRRGIPLAVIHSAANVPDSKALEEVVDAIEPIRRPRRGRPRKRPNKLHADKGYDFSRCPKGLRKRGITPRIARRGIESSERLGGHRWVVERTPSWLKSAFQVVEDSLRAARRRPPGVFSTSGER